MRILYSPQVSEKKINYIFEPDKIIAEMNGIIDIFDFTNMPDGEIVRTKEGLIDIETSLEIQPIINGYKKDGILHLTLLNFITGSATHEERYPVEFEV